jgi:enolase
MKSEIEKIWAEEIEDSRGNPTLQVFVQAGGEVGAFSVPSGASTGVREAYELRDPNGQGIRLAIEKVNEVISPILLGQDVLQQKEIDRRMLELDGTPNKNNLGGNSMVGVSIASAKAAAKISGLENYAYLRNLAEIKPSRKIPLLYMNLINGGKHARNNLVFQEYQVVPYSEKVEEALEIGIRVQNSLKKIIGRELGPVSLVLGDEGGYAPPITNVRKPLEYLSKALRENSLENKARLALDVAASSFYDSGKYKVDGKSLSRKELLNLFSSLIKEFNLLSIEDPFAQEDFDGFQKLKEAETNLMVIGDDLTVTNKTLLQKAIEDKSVSGIIIKPNQIGTLTETLETMQLARENGVELIISHRSGETDDDFIADLAFAFGCFGLKAGSPLKPERMVKYQRLIKISKTQPLGGSVAK